MSFDRNLTGHELELLKIAGASDDFIAFVDVFPRSSAGKTVLGWFERGTLDDKNAADGKPYSGGGFFDKLWSGDTETAFNHADSANQKHMKTLFKEPVRNPLVEVK